MRDRLLSACNNVEALATAYINPPPTFEELYHQFRNAIEIQQRISEATREPSRQYWTDRKYNGRGREERFGTKSRNYSRGKSPPRSHPVGQRCYVCGKNGCWSTTHTDEERKQAYNRFKARSKDKTPEAFARYIAWCEHPEDDPIQQFIAENDPPREESESDLSETDLDSDLGPDLRLETSRDPARLDTIDRKRLASYLADAAVLHVLTGEDPYAEPL